MASFQLNHIMDAELLKMKIRLSIFIIAGVCAGLPALAWSVSDITRHRNKGHRISVFIILLITDVAELFLSPYILIKVLEEMAQCKYSTCWVFVSLWSSLRICGFLLNQLVALEGIISVKYPRYACVFSSPVFAIFFNLVFVCIIIGHMCLNHIYVALLVFIASLIPWIISCGASCSSDRQSSRETHRRVLVVFIFTLLVIYLYLTFLCYFVLFFPFVHNYKLHWLDSCFLLSSLRLISDPLLCVLVCRQNLSLQMSQETELF